MSRKNAKPGDHHPRRVFVRKPRGQNDRQGALPGVQQKRQDTGERPGDARDIGCANVSAAGVADVGSAK